MNASEQDLIQAIVEEFRLDVPVIKDDEIYIAHAGEIQVDVSRDPTRRFIYDAHSGPAYVPGNKTVIAVPFEGDSAPRQTARRARKEIQKPCSMKSKLKKQPKWVERARQGVT